MRITKRLTYANVASTLALVVALGGGGAAVAAGLAKNSVGSPQLKAGAVKTEDLGGNAVTSGKVKDGALSGADVANDALTGADIDEGTLALPATPVVASGVGEPQGLLTGDPVAVATVGLTAPAAGYVLVTGEVSFGAAQATGYVNAFLRSDGVDRRSTYWEHGDADNTIDESAVMTVVVPVSKGAHTFSLALEEVAANKSTYYRPQVTAQYFPAGSAATQPPIIPPEEF